MTKRIVIEAEPRESLTIDLVGVEYVIEPPKGAFALKLARQVKDLEAAGSSDVAAQWSVVEGWVTRAFGPKQSKKVLARIDDDDDDLDIVHIMTLMQKIAELATENPTS